MVLAHLQRERVEGLRNNNKNTEAFLDHIYIVKGCLTACASRERSASTRSSSGHSSLGRATCAPGTLEDDGPVLGAHHLKEPENLQPLLQDAGLWTARAQGTDPKAKSYQEYCDYAGVDEGMMGSHPLCLKIPISRVSTSTLSEGGGQPQHLMYVPEQQIERE